MRRALIQIQFVFVQFRRLRDGHPPRPKDRRFNIILTAPLQMRECEYIESA